MDYLCAPIAPDEEHTLDAHRGRAIALAREYTRITGRLIFVPQTSFMGETDDKNRHEILEFEVDLINRGYFDRLVVCSQECHSGLLTLGMEHERIAAVCSRTEVITYEEAITQWTAI